MKYESLQMMNCGPHLHVFFPQNQEMIPAINLVFLKAIIDNLYNVDADLKLSFDQLFSKFGEIYWNLILKHGLRQKAQAKNKRGTYLEQVLYDAEKKYKIVEHIPYESLTTEMMVDITHQIKIKCKRYVVGALYEDTNHLFYSFSKRENLMGTIKSGNLFN